MTMNLSPRRHVRTAEVLMVCTLTMATFPAFTRTVMSQVKNHQASRRPIAENACEGLANRWAGAELILWQCGILKTPDL